GPTRLEMPSARPDELPSRPARESSSGRAGCVHGQDLPLNAASAHPLPEPDLFDIPDGVRLRRSLVGPDHDKLRISHLELVVPDSLMTPTNRPVPTIEGHRSPASRRRRSAARPAFP